MASITLTRHDDEVILLISDNGKGYDTTKTRKGVGIRNIMSRAEFFHGRIEIKSNTGEGYELRVELPLKEMCIPTAGISANQLPAQTC
jgi:signal transduction histidine kinase